MCTCSIMFPRPCLRLVTRLRSRLVSPRILCTRYNTHTMYFLCIIIQPSNVRCDAKPNVIMAHRPSSREQISSREGDTSQNRCCIKLCCRFLKHYFSVNVPFLPFSFKRKHEKNLKFRIVKYNPNIARNNTKFKFRVKYVAAYI